MADDPKDEIGSWDRPRVTFAIPEGAPRCACSSCGAAIVWIVTKNGKRMPVNAPAPSAPLRGESHFATCPNAGQHRKPRA